MNGINFKLNKMEIEKAKAEKYQDLFDLFWQEHNLIMTISEMDEVIAEVNKIQQNTLTLESKVDNRPMAIRLREFYGLKGMNVSNEAIKYTLEYVRTEIKQRLDNEKRLREGIDKLIDSMVGTHSVMTTPTMNYLQNLLNQ